MTDFKEIERQAKQETKLIATRDQIRAFKTELNTVYEGRPEWKHNQYHQVSRPYGEYLYHQDRVMFNANLKEWLAEQR